ncbi:JmjC domain-containing protein [Cordyceps fumosorosea ARSEF 2679]|uniref:JmjC domain-containing protein n=1 Tax=Cordyceps fumosorosea (strain ARSEF 2679) TaxID=1081104 RepID=A0A167RRL7_CORFA|nr:JmjC domain-containing protein [Cordyceps fumosorosea ARSEF 2679]OAA58863.1 JmjC domain-containing protein [Cordyceps fumosorosea ARSEF 2679]
MTTGHYLRSMKQLTNQWTPTNFRDDRRQRLYLKDIDCPPEWQEALQNIVNPVLFYLNNTVTRTGAMSETEDEPRNPQSDAASAGDLMSSLPREMRAENLMCYIGHEGTYTPAHREMCASLGQNIMVEASGDANGEKPGSSIWFMTESKDRAVVREYFLSMLGHDIEIEKHFAQVNAWKKAPFDVYVVEQRVGDFILVPPLAAHQVWNRGTRTMKVAWNRTTVETLELALQEALPKARLVCRDEQYKNKAMIYYTLQIYYQRLQSLDEHARKTHRDDIRNSFRAKQLASDFKKLFILFTKTVVDEVFLFREREVEFVPFDSCITCSYCRGNIFNRFLTCKRCVRTLVNGDEDTYDVCMECYAMGRSCGCLSGLQWCEQWHWSELVENHEKWRSMIISNDGFIDVNISPQPLEVAKQLSGKKSVAQICQEALRQRPWKDITQTEKELAPSESEEGEEGEQSKAKKSRSRRKKKGNVRRCHVCCHKELVYRMQMCSNPDCLEGYCFGVLYRAFDMMPQEVLQDENWQCPKCLGICNCGYCRRTGTTNPYTPKNTSLGHDTRAVADDRSVEALVDFRLHNLAWLKAAGEKSRGQDTKRMQRLREQADTAKAEGEHHEDDDAGPAAESSTHDSSHHERPTPIAGGTSYQQGAEPAGFAQLSLNQQAAGPSPQSAPWLINRDQAMNGQDGDDSSYPDPPVFAAQRIGMGYYEQDDTPDKILFDPYQAPTTEDLREEEADIPDLVKKSIRSAKRKAKKDNEDPEFIIKSHSRKRPKPQREHDFLDSMDPALFNEAPVASAQEPAPESGAGNTEDMTSVQPGSEEPKRKGNLRYDASEPLLRHAKPKASYVELEDLEVEEFNDNEQANTPPASAPGKPSPKPTMDAAPEVEADDATIDKNDSSAQVHSHSSAPTGQKRRGRPPAHSKRPPSVSLEIRSTRADITEKTKASSDTRRRGVGRPRKSGPGIASKRIRAEEADYEPASTAHKPRRGRPRASEPSRSPAPKRAGTAGQQFMSLKERMALRGKTFKIAKRGWDSTSSPSAPQPNSPKRSASMTVQLPSFTAVNKPTMVRKQSFEDVDENTSTASRQESGVNVTYAEETGGSGSDSGSSDNDIPARIDRSGSTSRPIFVALRGRGRPRGRPSMRPRGRGRP